MTTPTPHFHVPEGCDGYVSVSPPFTATLPGRRASGLPLADLATLDQDHELGMSGLLAVVAEHSDRMTEFGDVVACAVMTTQLCGDAMYAAALAALALTRLAHLTTDGGAV